MGTRGFKIPLQNSKIIIKANFVRKFRTNVWCKWKMQILFQNFI